MLRSAIRYRLTLAAMLTLLLTLALPIAALAQSSSLVDLSHRNGSLSPSAAASNHTISSTVGWQQTGLTVQQGTQFTISYTSGTWTVDVNNFSPVGPDGYPSNIDQQITPGCKYDSSLPYATLLGQIGNGSDFKVSTGGTFTASQSGMLSLRINDLDACLTDNAGSVVMAVAGSVSLGGTWINPANNFVVTGNTLHLAAHAYGGVGGVNYVNFTVWWSAIGSNPWYIACQVSTPSPVNSDMYQCDWNLTDGNGKAILNQTIKVSFDVYDKAGNRILSPNGVHPGKLQRGVSLRAPFNKGDTFYVKNLGGYHNHPQAGCAIGTFPDHCNNQLFGLDLVPNKQSDTTVLAPVGGIITGIPSDPKEFGCMQLMLYDGLSLNVCHFSTWNVKDGQQVVQGQVLGIRNTIHVHLSLDNRQAGSPYPPAPFSGAHTIEGMSLASNHDGKGETVTFAGQTFKVDVDEWQTWTGTSSN